MVQVSRLKTPSKFLNSFKISQKRHLRQMEFNRVSTVFCTFSLRKLLEVDNRFLAADDCNWLFQNHFANSGLLAMLTTETRYMVKRSAVKIPLDWVPMTKNCRWRFRDLSNEIVCGNFRRQSWSDVLAVHFDYLPLECRMEKLAKFSRDIIVLYHFIHKRRLTEQPNFIRSRRTECTTN